MEVTTNEAITLSASPANDNATAPGVIGGIKSLLCDACGRSEAARDGLCGDCIVDAEAEIAERGPWQGDRV